MIFMDGVKLTVIGFTKSHTIKKLTNKQKKWMDELMNEWMNEIKVKTVKF